MWAKRRGTEMEEVGAEEGEVYRRGLIDHCLLCLFVFQRIPLFVNEQLSFHCLHVLLWVIEPETTSLLLSAGFVFFFDWGGI